MKYIRLRKEEIKLSFFTDYMIIYAEDQKRSKNLQVLKAIITVLEDTGMWLSSVFWSWVSQSCT